MEEKEIVQYYVVNKNLPMSTGKIAAQIAHGAVLTTILYQKEPDFKEWLETGQVKIILEAKEKELEKLEKSGFVSVHDAGRTEIPPNSLTVVALPPMKREEAKPWVKRFQLLKK